MTIVAGTLFLSVMLAPSLKPTPIPTESAPLSEPTVLTEDFLRQVGRGEVDQALDNVMKGSTWSSQQQKVDLLRGQIKTAMGLYGAYLGIERVQEKQYSPSIVRLTYVMKLERNYLVWNLVFYRPRERWEMNFITFVDQPSGLD